MNATFTARRISTQPEWFASWFDSEHYHRLYAHRSDDEAARFIDRLVERRHLVPGARVLDLGCGTGRHARRLAANGFDVVGLDLSAESLRVARHSESSRLRFIRQDMRLPFLTGTFDHVLNLFTSFGYFDDPADQVTVIHNIAAALKPGGSLVLDYLNVRHALAHLRPRETVERGDATYRIRRWADAGHIFKRVEIDDRLGCGPIEFTERVSRLGLPDFRFMFELCGMHVAATYGDYDLTPFDERESPRLILVATFATGSSGCD
jgi:SAM-dependent methyltransferase